MHTAFKRDPGTGPTSGYHTRWFTRVVIVMIVVLSTLHSLPVSNSMPETGEDGSSLKKLRSGSELWGTLFLLPTRRVTYIFLNVYQVGNQWKIRRDDLYAIHIFQSLQEPNGLLSGNLLRPVLMH